MRFEELTKQAQKRAWLEQCWALRDCPGDIVPFEEYGAAAEWAGVEFDESGEAH
jgi:hypothetical protein